MSPLHCSLYKLNSFLHKFYKYVFMCHSTAININVA